MLAKERIIPFSFVNVFYGGSQGHNAITDPRSLGLERNYLFTYIGDLNHKGIEFRGRV